MTQYLNKSFSVYTSGDADYRDNWELTFGKKPVCGDGYLCEHGYCSHAKQANEPVQEPAESTGNGQTAGKEKREPFFDDSRVDDTLPRSSDR